MSFYRRTMGWVASRRWGAAAFKRLLPVADRAMLRLTKGRRLFTSHAIPTLILTSTGRNSGEPRSQPLCYVREGSDYIVVGSNWGQEHHPAWTSNLMARPKASIMVAGDELPVHASLVADDEWEQLYGRFEAMSANYAAYKGWTGGRKIRMFRLTPE